MHTLTTTAHRGQPRAHAHPHAPADQPSYLLRRLISFATGAALILAETLMLLSRIRDVTVPWHDQPLVIAVAVAGIAQAVAVAVLSASWRQRRYTLAALTLSGLACAVAFTFASTYERTAAAREARATAADAANAPQRMSASRVASARERVQAECFKAGVETRGQECRRRESELADALAVEASQARPATVRHLGALDVVPDIALPAMLMLLGFAFLAFPDAPAQRSMRGEPSGRTIEHAQLDLHAVSASEAAALSSMLRPDSPSGHRTGPSGRDPNRPVDARRDDVLAAISTDVALGREIASQAELCRRFGVPRSTMSDWLADAERSGRIPTRRTIGRCKTIR